MREPKEAYHSLWADIPSAQNSTNLLSSAQMRESAGVGTLVHAVSFAMAKENCHLSPSVLMHMCTYVCIRD